MWHKRTFHRGRGRRLKRRPASIRGQPSPPGTTSGVDPRQVSKNSISPPRPTKTRSKARQRRCDVPLPPGVDAASSLGNMSQSQTHLEKSVELNDRLYKAHYYLGRVYSGPRQTEDRPPRRGQNRRSLAPSFGLPFNAAGAGCICAGISTPRRFPFSIRGGSNVKDGDELTDIYYHLGPGLRAARAIGTKPSRRTAKSLLEVRGGNLDALRQRGFAYAEKGENEKARADLTVVYRSGRRRQCLPPPGRQQASVLALPE